MRLEGHHRRRVLLELNEKQVSTLATKLGVDNLLVKIEGALTEVTKGYDLRQYKNKIKELLGEM